MEERDGAMGGGIACLGAGAACLRAGWVEREENVGAGLVSMAPQGSSSSSGPFRFGPRCDD